MINNRLALTAVIFSLGITTSCSASSGGPDITLQKGKYLIEIAGCNDCHTSGYAPSGGNTPEAEWLLGDDVGFRGPWGTTYAINLRYYIGGITEDEWVARARTLRTRPPMPWWALNAMTEDDLRSIHLYVRSLGAINKPAPSYVPPDKSPDTPYIQWPEPPK